MINALSAKNLEGFPKPPDSRRGKEGEYRDHVRREEMEYLVAYEQFEANLTPAHRKALGGAQAPDIEDPRTTSTRRLVIGADRDMADSVVASYSPDMAAAVDGTAEQLAELVGISMDQARKVVEWTDARVDREAEFRKSRVVVKVTEAFLNCANPRLLSAGLAYASDLALTSGMGTMHDYALKIAVSRAAVSKVAKWWRKELGLPPSSHMRDDSKCKIYSDAQRAKHWRRKKYGKKQKA